MLRVLALVTLLAVACSDSDDDPSRPAATEGEIGVFSPEVGDCVLDATEVGSETENLELISCDKAHDGEVFHVETVTEPEGFNPVVLQERALEACGAGFEAFVGVPDADSSLTFYYYLPSAEAWADGERSFTCFVHDPSGVQLTGSAEGVER